MYLVANGKELQRFARATLYTQNANCKQTMRNDGNIGEYRRIPRATLDTQRLQIVTIPEIVQA